MKITLTTIKRPNDPKEYSYLKVTGKAGAITWHPLPGMEITRIARLHDHETKVYTDNGETITEYI